jgi:glycosyltransferase involved in cell wall biosynthesis
LDVPHVVVARNLEPIYDNETAIRAFARLIHRWPSARLTIAGSGPDRCHLESVVNELALPASVTFAGRLGRDEMAALFRSADLCINASRVDNMPVSVLEAMASGVPVVTTNVGGIPYIAHDGDNALLVEPGDPEAMANAADRLLSDATLRTRIVSSALKSVAVYSWGHASALWLSAYNDALAARPA